MGIKKGDRDVWVAQPVKRPTLARVMISQFEFEPRIRLSAISTELASDPLHPPLSAPPLSFSLSLS